MINVNMESDTNSSDDCSPPFDFKLPDCRLPNFLDTPSKWSDIVYNTNTLTLWCDLQLKIESYNPMFLSEEEVDIVVKAMANDIIYIHGLSTFFPSNICKDCGIVHSVSYTFIFSFNVKDFQLHAI